MFDGLSIIGLTPPALLLISVLMVLTGRLVPRATYQEKVKEAEQWHQAYELERTARITSDAQTRELFEVAKTSETFLKAVFEKSESIKSGDS
jgi:hypothetical protein